MIDYMILGKNGSLGSTFVNHGEFSNHVAFGHTEADITDYSTIEYLIKEHKPKVLINCSAYTNVTEAETNYKKALQVNGFAVGNLAKVCRKLNIKLIHFSTDYVFPGTNPDGYTEEDEPSPINYYGMSKLVGENIIQEVDGDFLIIRVSWLFGKKGNNFVSVIKKMLKERNEVKIVSDQIGKVTNAEDVVYATKRLLDIDAKGIFHFANDEYCSRYEFTKEIKKIMLQREQITCNILPIKAIEYIDKTPRPQISILKTDKYKHFTGETIDNWRVSLKKYLDKC